MEEIERLYQKFLRKECTRDEAERLLAYFQRQEHADEIQELIAVELAKTDSFSDDIDNQQAVERNRERLREAIQETEKPTPVRRVRYPYWLAAAGVLLVCALSVWLYQRSNSDVQPQLTSAYGGDVLPGGNRATLTFEDGTAISLDEAHTGIIADETQLHYADGAALADQIPNVEFATLTTPRAGQYQITLGDGTKVWLNAASSLRYPTSFQKNIRRVELLTGEAYFDVSPDAKKPFVVVGKSQEVTVLGTEFNINTYDQHTITTLVEGKVALSNDTGDEVRLHPNEQAILAAGNIQVRSVDVNDYTSWTEGQIVLNDATLTEVSAQIERWYDVDVQLPGIKNNRTAYIVFSRSERLSNLLKALEETYNVQMKIEGRRLIIKE